VAESGASSKAASLVEDFAEERVSDGHGEAEPTLRLVGVLDVSGAGGEPGGQGDFQAAREFEVVARADEMEYAALLIHG
jgi:hypothetical protein